MNSAFTTEDLEANRAGFISESQVALFKAEKDFWRNLMVITVVTYVLAIMVALLNGVQIQQTAASTCGIGILLNVFFLIVFVICFQRWQTLKYEVAGSLVQAVEGTVKKSRELHRSRGFIYKLDIQAVRFEVPRATYEKVEEQTRYRIYYLALSSKLLSLERVT